MKIWYLFKIPITANYHAFMQYLEEINHLSQHFPDEFFRNNRGYKRSAVFSSQVQYKERKHLSGENLLRETCMYQCYFISPDSLQTVFLWDITNSRIVSCCNNSNNIMAWWVYFLSHMKSRAMEDCSDTQSFGTLKISFSGFFTIPRTSSFIYNEPRTGSWALVNYSQYFILGRFLQRVRS